MGSDRGESKLGIWLTFAGTILAALIGGVFVLLAARGGDQPAPGPQPATQQTPRSAVAGAVAPSTGTPTADTQPAGGAAKVRWQGTLAIGQELGTRRDLDQVPPRLIDPSSDGDIFTSGITSDGNPYGTINSGPEGKATVAVWTVTGGPPDYDKCRETVLAQAVKQAQLRKGAIVCVKTSDGRIARLTVTNIDDRNKTITFDTVVWEPTG